MKHRPVVLSLAFVAFATVIATAAPAQQSDVPAFLPDIARIVERGTLVVAQVDEDVPLMFVKGVDDEIDGFDIDLARAMAESLRVELRLLRTAKSYDDVIRQVVAGEADQGISFLSRTARRARHFLYSRPYFEQSMTLLINRVKGLRFRDKCPTVEELITKTEFSNLLGVERDSSYEARVRGINPDAKLREFDTIDESFASVLSGETAISLQGELSARRFLKENPGARIRLQYCRIGRVMDQIAVAVRPEQYDLLHWVNVFLDERGVRYTVSDLIDHEGAWSF